MAVDIKLKRSSVPGKIPTTSSLELGELALNTYDGKVYMKKQVGNVQSIIEVGSGSGGAGGTVTSVSVSSANGFAGSVANPSTTPTITLSTTVTGILKGNGTSISAASAGTDYITPTQGTASWAVNAVTASYFSGSIANAISASYASSSTSASYALVATSASYASSSTSASYSLNATSASYALVAVSASYASSSTSASYASSSTSASYALNATSASYAATSSYANNFTVAGTLTAQTIVVQIITSSQELVTGSLTVSGSLTALGGVTGSLLGTASWAQNAITASYVLNAVSASYASASTSASYASSSTSASYALTASYALNVPDTSSYALFATSASYASASTSASYAANATSASYSLNTTSASYASASTSASYASSSTSASYALNATSASYTLFATSASYASASTSASFANVAVSASYASSSTSASYALAATSASYASSSTSASYALFATSASYASASTSASYAVNSTSASYALFATSASYASASTSASYAANASVAISASYASASTSASYALNATSASYALNSTSASYTLVATSASYASASTSASYASASTSASYASSSTSASYSLNSTSASYALNATSASYALNATSASYALNGGVTQIIAGSNISISPTNGLGQVTISSTGGGGTGSFNTATGSYGSFFDTTTQTASLANVGYPFYFNTTDLSNGVSISGSTNTFIKIANAGVYDLQFSAQLARAVGSGTENILIWIRKNGTDLAWTNTDVTFAGGTNVRQVAAWNWFLNAAAGDAYEIVWSTTSTNIVVQADTTPTPDIPSIIATVARIDQFLSNTGSFTGSFTGSLLGTASFATSASYAFNSTSASYALNSTSASYALNSTSASYASASTSASYASASTSASYAVNATTASYALIATSASYASASTSASYAQNATSASYALNATTASYSLNSTSASYASASTSASYALNATSASYSLNSTSASYALNATTAQTASYANNFTVAGTLTAQTIVVQTITSSISVVTGSMTVSGSLTVLQGITGSLFGTSSWAVSASQALNATSASYALNATSASYAATASLAPLYLPLVGGTMTGNITFTDDQEGIVWTRNTDGASIRFYNTGDGDTDSRLEFNTNDNDNEYFRWTHSPSGGTLYESMRLVANSANNAVLTVSGSIRATSFTGSLQGTASWANNAITASYSLNSTSASYALNSTSASYALNSTSASYSLNSTSASYAINATTASYVNPLNQNVTITGSILLNQTSGTTYGIYNPSNGIGLILRGRGNSQTADLRIVANGGAWTDNITTAYFQITSSVGNYMTFMGGTYGADAPFDRFQLNSKLTTFTNLGYGLTPVPTHVVEIINSGSSIPVLGLRGAPTQNANYIDVTSSGSASGNIFVVTSAGNVGIGTTAPSQLLEIQGSAQIGNDSVVSAGLHIARKNTNQSKSHYFLSPQESPTYQWIEGGFFTSEMAGISVANNSGKPYYEQYVPAGQTKSFGFINQTTSGSSFTNTAATASIILYQGGNIALTPALGNVGIGTTTPVATLHVSRDGGAGTIRLLRIDNSNATYQQNVYLDMNTSKDILWSQGSANGGTFWDAGVRGYGFSINSSRIVTFDQNGNVGIGTSSPTYKLDVNGTFRSNAVFTDASSITYWGNGGTGTAYGGLTWDTGYATIYATSGNTLRFGANGSSTKMILNTNGNVGIGTTSPINRLHIVEGTSAVSIGEYSNGAIIWMDGSNGDFAGGDYFSIRVPDETRLSLNYVVNEVLSITSGSSVGIGTTSPGAKLDVNGSAYFGASDQVQIIGTDNGGLNYYAADGTSLVIKTSLYNNPIVFQINSVEKVRISSSGNVGIGTTSPAYPLHIDNSLQQFRVSGNSNNFNIYSWASGTNIWSTENIYFGRDAGTNNKFFFQPGSGASTTLYINTATGNVGIATTSPGATLDVEGNLLIRNAQFEATSSATSGATTLATIATGSYKAVFVDYVALSGSNQRAGTFMGTWNGSTVQYTDYSTVDIGTTSAVTMSVSISGGNALVQATTPASWTVTATYRTI